MPSWALIRSTFAYHKYDPAYTEFTAWNARRTHSNWVCGWLHSNFVPPYRPIICWSVRVCVCVWVLRMTWATGLNPTFETSYCIILVPLCSLLLNEHHPLQPHTQTNYPTRMIKDSILLLAVFRRKIIYDLFSYGCVPNLSSYTIWHGLQFQFSFSCFLSLIVLDSIRYGRYFGSDGIFF